MPAGRAQRKFTVAVSADTTITTTSETVAATLPGLNTGGVDDIVRLNAWLQVTLGATVTAVTLRIRRTSLTGTLVGEGNPVQISSAAASTEEHEIRVEDNPGEVASQTYVVTIQQTGATGNGTVLQAELEAVIG